MHDVVLIFADLFIDPGAANPQSVPALPALSALLARGQTQLAGDWRRWVLREYGGAQIDRVPVAAATRLVTRPALQSDPYQWWLVTPVHLEAGLTEVRMADELPVLDAAEGEALMSDFNRQFAADGLQLEMAGGRRGFLAASAWNETITVDPLRVLGHSVEAALPTGPDSAKLRRLMTEVQMWLHDHAVNEKRAQRGEPTVNALWIWGGGGQLPAQPAANLPSLASEESFLVGLWKSWKGPIATPATSFAMLQAQDITSAVVVLSCVTASRSPAETLEAIERDWMAPVLSALKRGVLRRARLHVNDRLYSVSRRDAYRFWRSHRSWLEAVVA